MCRVLLLCLSLCLGGILPSVSSAAPSPPLSQRSLLLPGLWWDQSHPGHGFDLHLNGRDLGLLWYTFRPDGSPVWYLASGRFDDDGLLHTELLETAWNQGVLSSRAVGELRLRRLHAEAAQLDWQLDGGSGSWQLQPFRLGAQRLEQDPSGAYYDPTRSGFGLSLDALGALLSAVYYVYDDDGRPQWWLGSGEPGSGPLYLDRYRGSCPACPAQPLQPNGQLALQLGLEAGRASLQFADPQQLLSPEFRTLNRPLQRFTAPLEARQADFRLAYFDSADQLESYLEQGMLESANWTQPSIDFSPAPPAVPINVSSTNLIEPGVDEGDVLKSDGRVLAGLTRDAAGRRGGAVRFDRLDADSLRLTPLGQFELSTEREADELYLSDRHLVAISSTRSAAYDIIACPPPPYHWLETSTTLEVFDRQESGLPTPRWRAKLDGELVASRRLGNDLLLVQRYTANLTGFDYGATAPDRVAANRALLASTPLQAYLPTLQLGEAEPEPLVQAAQVLLPPAAAQRAQPDFTLITRIDLDDPSDRESLAVVGGVAAVHVSTQALYLTTTRFVYSRQNGSLLPPPGYSETDIHRIDFADGTLQASASGSVDGWIDPDLLLQPFRLSEYQNKLRVVTGGNFGVFGQNRLTVLEPSTLLPGLLRTVSMLPNAQQPFPIGKPDERLYATRFVGPRLYAVTFRLTDPLYAIDLSEPSAPRIAGQIELPGFSEYLHPISEDLLLGVGFHADRSGRANGLKLSLFEVADPGRPQLLDEKLVGEFGSYSALFRSHHAFSSLRLGENQTRVALPIRVHGQIEPGADAPAPSNVPPWTHSGLYVFDVQGRGSAARLSKRGAAIVLRPDPGPQPFDDATNAARSVLLESGLLYLNDGKYWTAPWDGLELPAGPQ